MAFSFLEFGSHMISTVAVICTAITTGTMMLVIFWLVSEKWEHLILKCRRLWGNLKSVWRASVASTSRRTNLSVVWFKRVRERQIPGRSDSDTEASDVVSPISERTATVPLAERPSTHPLVAYRLRNHLGSVRPDAPDGAISAGLRPAAEVLLRPGLGDAVLNNVPNINVEAASPRPPPTEEIELLAIKNPNPSHALLPPEGTNHHSTPNSIIPV